MHWIIKMTFLLFYLRLAHNNTFKYVIWGTMGLNTIFTITIWFIYCLQCIPLDAYFHKAAHPDVTCLSTKVLYYVPAALVSISSKTVDGSGIDKRTRAYSPISSYSFSLFNHFGPSKRLCATG